MGYHALHDSRVVRGLGRAFLYLSTDLTIRLPVYPSTRLSIARRTVPQCDAYLISARVSVAAWMLLSEAVSKMPLEPRRQSGSTHCDGAWWGSRSHGEHCQSESSPRACYMWGGCTTASRPELRSVETE